MLARPRRIEVVGQASKHVKTTLLHSMSKLVDIPGREPSMGRISKNKREGSSSEFAAVLLSKVRGHGITVYSGPPVSSASCNCTDRQDVLENTKRTDFDLFRARQACVVDSQR